MEISQKRLDAIKEVDNMPQSLREVVHEYGLPIVRVLTKFGIKNPQHIREVVRELWAGGREGIQNSSARNTIDVLLSREMLSYAGLVRILADYNLAIVSMEPTRAMLDASMNEVSNFDVRCTKEEKHRRRLRAATRAGMKEAMASKY